MGKDRRFYLMHKDIPVTLVELSESGDIIQEAENPRNKAHMPIITKEGNYRRNDNTG